MSAQSDVLYVPDLSKKLGMTDSALRMAVHRRTGAVPPPFKLNRKMAWLAADVDAWLKAKACEAKRKGGAK